MVTHNPLRRSGLVSPRRRDARGLPTSDPNRSDAANHRSTQAVATAQQLPWSALPAAASPGFQQHIHVFRALAIVLVVATHCLPSLDWSARPLTGRVLNALCIETSILFVFISGYLFQHLLPKYRPGRYYRSKLTNVIIPYVIVSIPALIVFTQWTNRHDLWSWFYDEPVHMQVFYFLITGKHLAPLWFIPTITLFYAVAPVLVWGDRRGQLYYLLPPLVLLAAYLGRDGYYGPLNKAVYLLPAYLMGMMFSRYRDRCAEVTRRYWWMLALIAGTAFLWHVLEGPQPPYSQIIMKLSLAALLVVALSRVAGRIGNRLDYLADVSMSIFLVHAYFISAIKVGTTYFLGARLYAGVDPELLAGSVFAFVAYTLVVVLLCLGSIRIAQRILGRRSRMVIGA